MDDNSDEENYVDEENILNNKNNNEIPKIYTEGKEISL